MQFSAPDDGRKNHPKHVERFTRINNLRNRCILLVIQQLFDICLLSYVQFSTPDDGREDRPKQVELFTRINNLRNRCIMLVVL